MPERFRVPPFEKLVKLYRVLAPIIVLLVIVLASAKLIRNPVAKPDLEVYLHAASLILAGNNPYLTPIPAGTFFYLYPPLFAVLFIPFTFLPINVAVVAWCVLNVFLVGWVTKAFYERMAEVRFLDIPEKTRWVICFFALLPTGRFIFSHLSYGQANIAVLALVVLGLVCLQKHQKFGGSVAIGISIAIKVISLPFAVWFAARRNLWVTLGIASGVLAGLLLPALLLGFEKKPGISGLLVSQSRALWRLEKYQMAFASQFVAAGSALPLLQRQRGFRIQWPAVLPDAFRPARRNAAPD